MGKILILENSDFVHYLFRKEILERLLERNDMYISFPNGQYVETFKEMGCHYIETPIARHGTNPVDDAKLLLHYRRILRKIQPDVVLTYTIKPNVYGGLACQMEGIPYIASITGLGSALLSGGLTKKVSVFLYKLAFRKVNCVFFQNYTNRRFFEDLGIRMPQIHMIPGSGVNLEKHYFEEYPSYETPISFLFLGRLMQHKGVGELLEAASIIGKKYPEVKFRLAGFFEEEYRQILDTFPRYPNVEYLGYRQDVHPLLKECHAIVLPSYHEGLANVLLEAAATGRPVLASNIPGCMETFVEGVSGMGFRPRDGIDLADKLEQFIRLPYEKKREMGLEGRKKIAREFDRNFVVDAYAEEIQQILGQEETRAYDMV